MKEDKDGKNRKKEEYQGIYFLVFVVFLYISLFLFHSEKTRQALGSSADLFIRIVPMVFLIILFMGIISYFVKAKAVLKYVGKGSGIKGWVLAILAGMLSHGPVYIWYPLLKDFRNRGMKNSLVAVFLYNRAIKIPLLPLMVYYFGIKFAVVLIIYLVIASIFEGKIIEMLVKNLENKQNGNFQ
ncbi:MAG: permease [Candidatus Auribacterota bacterium]|nr:permease [Candidatus Auribacterota bacterium]